MIKKKTTYLIVSILTFSVFLYSIIHNDTLTKQEREKEKAKTDYIACPNDKLFVKIYTKEKYLAIAFDGKGSFIVKSSSSDIVNKNSRWSVVGKDSKGWGDSFSFSSHSRQLIFDRMYTFMKLTGIIEIPNINIAQPIIVKGNILANCLLARPIANNKYENIRMNIETGDITLTIQPRSQLTQVKANAKSEIKPSSLDTFLVVIGFVCLIISIISFVSYGINRQPKNKQK